MTTPIAHRAAPAPVVALAIVNARIWTGDIRRPWADAVLVRGERLEMVGASAEIKKRAGTAVPVLDAKGRMMIPAFTDGAAPPLGRVQAAIVNRPNGTSAAEQALGMLAPGTPATLLLLDRDITRMPPAELDNARVVLTMVDGRVTYDLGGLVR